MTFSSFFRSSPKGPPSRAYVCHATAGSREQSAGLTLARTYRTARPAQGAIDRLKFQLGWDKIDEHGRYRVQQWLANLVENCEGPTITGRYHEAIAADFAVSVETSALHHLLAKNATAAPQLERELQQHKELLRCHEEGERLLRGELDDAKFAHDMLVEECSQAQEQAQAYKNSIGMFLESAVRLAQPLSSSSNGISPRGHHLGAGKRSSMPPLSKGSFMPPPIELPTLEQLADGL